MEQGLLVEPESSEALAEAIAAIYSDSEQRNRLGALGEVQVKKYEMKRVAARFLRAGIDSAGNAEANSASADRNILAVSKLERRALENRTAAERFSDAVVAHWCYRISCPGRRGMGGRVR